MILESTNFRLELRAVSTEVVEMFATYGPGSRPPPRHYHPKQQERFAVQSGALWFEIDGRERVVRAGEEMIVPARAVHRLKNASADEPATTVWEVRPALRLAQLFEALHEMGKRGGRSVLALAALGWEFRNEMVLASPPRLVQTCVFGLLAPIARALGKGPTYSQRGATPG